MDIKTVREMILSNDTPPQEAIDFLSTFYEGLELLSLYDELNEHGKLHPSLPHVNLYNSLTPDDRFVIFIGRIGLCALQDPNIQQELLRGTCNPEILGSLSAFNESYQRLESINSTLSLITKETMVEQLVKSNCPLKLIPNAMLKSRTFVDYYCKYNWDFENGDLFLEVLNTTAYTPELEQRLLDALNIPSLEGYLKGVFLRQEESTNIAYTIDLDQMVIAKLYTLRLLDKNKSEISDYSHNVYTEEVLQDGKVYGLYSSDENILSVYPFMMGRLKDLVIASSHEAYHVIQDRNVREADIDADRDVDIYSMDAYLQEVLGIEYYKENYQIIGKEYDAETKAIIDVSNMEPEEQSQRRIDKLMSLVESLSDEHREKLEELKESSSYMYLLTRTWDGERKSLYTLFEQVINEQLYEATDIEKFKADLYSKYPIFKYMLKIDQYGVSFKTPKDYIEDLSNTTDKEVAKIYLHLISNDFHPLKKSKKEATKEQYLNEVSQADLSPAQRSALTFLIEATSDKYERHYSESRGV